MSNQEQINKVAIIRNYVRQFFLGGFKADKDFIKGENELKSHSKTSSTGLRQRKQKIANYLGNSMEFESIDGKSKLIADSRAINTNPFYDIFKAKRFTDIDIALRFLIMDSLSVLEMTDVSKRNQILKELLRFDFDNLKTIDSNNVTIENIIALVRGRITSHIDVHTIEKHIENLIKFGLITKKEGVNAYSVTKDSEELKKSLKDLRCAIKFFSESDPLGVIGYYTTEMLDSPEFFGNDYDIFRFKQNYIFRAIDSEIIYKLACAITNKKAVQITVVIEDYNNKILKEDIRKVYPYKIYISSQSGRQHLFYWKFDSKEPSFVRIDQIESVEILSETEDINFDTIYNDIKRNYWGVSFKRSDKTEYIEFVVEINDNEQHILEKLKKEKRFGKIEKVENSSNQWKFSVEVYDTREMIVWIRTFIGRIVSISCENEDVKIRLENDFKQLCKIYGINGGDNNAV